MAMATTTSCSAVAGRLSGDGRGGFRAKPIRVPSGGQYPGHVNLGDINADGKLDVIATHSADEEVTVLLAK